MKYTFNEVDTSQTKDTVQIFVEEMPEYADFYPTKKQKNYLGYLIVENNVKVVGNLKKLSNLAVGRLITEICRNEGKNITIVSSKSRQGKTSIGEEETKFFNEANSDLPF